MRRNVLMVIAPEAFRDEELLVPRGVFQGESWQVDTVSTKAGRATGMLGAHEEITKTLADLRPESYDAVVVVGGMGSPAHLWENTDLHRILQKMDADGKVVAAICLSGAVLAKAGVLNGKKATVWEMPESLSALKAGGAHYTAEPVTVDGRIITANGPDAADTFARSVVSGVQALSPAAR